MKTNTALIVLGVLLVGLFLGYTVLPSSLGGRAGYGGMMSETRGQNVDRHFIEQMIPHHEGAIAMATIALEKSKRPEVLSLARDIIEAQEREVTEMHDWYHEWFEEEVPEDGRGMMMHMDSMTGDIGALTSASAGDFDREFLEQMIPHHEMAIMMAQMLLAGTERPEMKQLGNNIITSQSQEIGLMRSWLQDWTN